MAVPGGTLDVVGPDSASTHEVHGRAGDRGTWSGRAPYRKGKGRGVGGGWEEGGEGGKGVMRDGVRGVAD